MADDPLVAIVLPVFCFIGLGYLIVATRLLPDDVGDALANFVFTIALPLLLFRPVGTPAVPPFNPWPFWLAYFGGVALNIALGILIIRKVFGRDARVGVAAAMSIIYFLMTLLVCWLFYTLMTQAEAKSEHRS